MKNPTGVSKLVKLPRRALHTRGLLLEETPRGADEHIPLKRNFTGKVLLRFSIRYKYLTLSRIAEFRMLPIRVEWELEVSQFSSEPFRKQEVMPRQLQVKSGAPFEEDAPTGDEPRHGPRERCRGSWRKEACR